MSDYSDNNSDNGSQCSDDEVLDRGDIVIADAHADALANGSGKPNGHAHPEGAPNDLIEYVRLDYIRNADGNWVTKRTEEPLEEKGDEFSGFSFSILRSWDYRGLSFTVSIQIKNEKLKHVLKEAMGEVQGFSWNDAPLNIVPQMLLTFYPILKNHVKKLFAKDSKDPKALHLQLLVNFLYSEYRSTLDRVSNLLSNREMTFEHLWAILVPRSIIYLKCPISGQPRAVQLLSSSMETTNCGRGWQLQCEYTDMASSPKQKKGIRFGRASISTKIWEFKGTLPISSLSAFPLEYHPDKEELTAKLIERGTRWKEYDGIHHMRYDGVAFSYSSEEPRVTVASRIMIDKGTFVRINPNSYINDIKKFKSSAVSSCAVANGCDAEDAEQDVTPGEELLLATPLLYGFSLADKMWLVFNVELVTQIQWQTDAFSNLVLPEAQKSLIKALVESHQGPGEEEAGGFDDFIMGKGKGLIINLFGPPGVGKTLSAEATSEYVKKPLYVVGVGEIGRSLENKLKKIFDVACVWKAIVLIDEADVFMEQRSVHDLDRNALVAIFLRQLEYYQGILFLTTNRVKVFDEAFQSRIHISLHYQDLSTSAKRQIWGAFLKKAGMDLLSLSEDEWDQLSHASVNGRQIKNAVRSCSGLAMSRGERLAFKHVLEVLAVMEQFERDLKGEKRISEVEEEEDWRVAKRQKTA